MTHLSQLLTYSLTNPNLVVKCFSVWLIASFQSVLENGVIDLDMKKFFIAAKLNKKSRYVGKGQYTS